MAIEKTTAGSNVATFPPRPKQKKKPNPNAIEKGIARTPFGFRVFVTVNGRQYSQRFPADATITALRNCRAALRTDALRADARGAAARPAAGSFAEDVRIRYLPAVKAMLGIATRTREIEAWVAAFGPRPRASITSTDIRTVLQQWHLTGRPLIEHRRDPETGKPLSVVVGQAGLSTSSCDKRRTALMHLYNVLDGKSAPNPVRDVPRMGEASAEPRGVPMATVARILAAMTPGSKSEARAAVFAYTGIPPAQAKQINPDTDLHLEAGTVYVARRRKGKGTKPRVVALLPEAIAAFRRLHRADGFGPYSTSGLNHAVGRACRTLGIPIITLYDLRHSFAAAVYAASGDIHAVQVLLDHSDPKLTARYAMAAENPRVRLALTATATALRPRTRGSDRKAITAK